MADDINFGSIYGSTWWGEGVNNDIGWGSIYEAIAGGSSLTQEYLNRVLADGGVVESAECIDDNINASIYIKPSGYKNGKIFAQIPTPTFGEELITNGDFSDGIENWKAKSSTISYGDGVLICDNSIGNSRAGAYQQTNWSDSKVYKVTVTMQLLSGVTNGRIKILSSTNIGSGQSDLALGKSLIVGGNAETETFYLTPATSDVSIQFACNSTNAVFTIDNISVKEYTGADIDFLRGSLKTRVNKEGNVVDITDSIPPLDYSNGGCPVFNFEPSSTNLLPYSEDFDVWTNIANVTFDKGYPSPDGGNNATKITCTDTSGIAFVAYRLDMQSNETKSIYIKGTQGETTRTLDRYTDTSTPLTVLTGEWQRVDVNAVNLEFFYTVDFRGGTAREIYVWGAMAEPLPYATSYIPNNGSASGVTRLADQPQPINTTPFNLTSITETFEDGTTNVISPVPSSYTISQGRISKIVGQ